MFAFFFFLVAFHKLDSFMLVLFVLVELGGSDSDTGFLSVCNVVLNDCLF